MVLKRIVGGASTNRRSSGTTVRLLSALSVGCLLSLSMARPSLAEGWSMSVIKHHNHAVECYNTGEYGVAKNEFRIAIGINPTLPDLYEGLMNAGFHLKEWDQVAFAAEKLAQMDPTKRNSIAYFYGMALYNLNKDDEAVPWLKRALATADQPEAPYKPQAKSEADIPKDDSPRVAVVPTTPAPTQEAPPPPPREKIDPNKFVNSYENAIQSESIVTAEYLGYDKKADIHYNNPMLAEYHIDKILKGPPLNPHLPIKYEFHDHVSTDVPKGWKFDDKTVMPEKGSKWILFIEWAVPKKGMFETYQGSYGRQPATEENLNQLYQLLDAHNMRLTQ